MAFEIIGAELAAEAGISKALASKDPTAAQALEDTLVRAGFAAKDFAHRVSHFLVFKNCHEQAPQVIAKRSLVPLAESVNIEFLVGQFAESASSKVGLTADQPEET